MWIHLSVLFAMLHVLLKSTVNADNERINEISDKKYNEIEDLLKWIPPISVQKSFPYFLSGFDNDGSPIWIFEFGKWDIYGFLQNEPKAVETFDNYTRQMIERMYDSTKKFSTKEKPIDEFVLVCDADGLSFRQLSNPTVILRALNMARTLFELERSYGPLLKQGYIVNANFIANSLWSLVKPLVGSLTNKAVVYGTNRETWKVALLKDLPKDSLPNWLGGTENHKPIEVYG